MLILQSITRVNYGSLKRISGVCTCSYHHTRLYEGGYKFQRIADDEQILNEQFTRQQNASDASQFDFEKSLRSDKNTFDTVRELLPTHYRFRVVDAEGQNIRDQQIVCVDDQDISIQSTSESSHSTVPTKYSTRIPNRFYDNT